MGSKEIRRKVATPKAIYYLRLKRSPPASKELQLVGGEKER